MRRSGILMPIFSLPSKYGIGCFSKEAYEFVDFLEKAGQKLWQILPLGPTSYGDSPYQSFSTFAGNPYFIDLDELVKEGMLTSKELDKCDMGDTERYIDYEKMYKNRMAVLRNAFERSHIESDERFVQFCNDNAEWLPDYALFMAVKDSFNGVSWDKWDEDIRLRKPEAMQRYKDECSGQIRFYEFLQYKFACQWKKLKSYANSRGIEIVGDIPIYVAFDSADVWASPELFQLDESLLPTAVAGCPPDAFCATGQLWGNPLYRWDYHKQTGFSWWMKRFAHSFSLYDVVRVDHFRAFDEYYSIPFGDKTAEFGKWIEGPGLELFEVLKSTLGSKQIIAEDLGFLTPSVIKLVNDTGFPGMKVLHFGFYEDSTSEYLPHNYGTNCVVYTGTHDNDTTVSWYRSMSRGDKEFTKDYLNVRSSRNINWVLIRTALSSVADTAVIPIQDYLGLGNEARINTPSTLGDNWKWRVYAGELTNELADKIRRLTKVYGR